MHNNIHAMSDVRVLLPLHAAARAYFDKPCDAETAQTLLALPLAPEQWPGASDEEILEIAPFLSVVFGSVAWGHDDEEMAWARAAVEANERRLAPMIDGTSSFVEATADYAWALMMFGRVIMNHAEISLPDARPEIQQILEHAGRLIENVPHDDARRQSLSSHLKYLLGAAECAFDHTDAGRKYLEQAQEDLVSMVKAGRSHYPLGGDPRLLLVSTLVWLDKFDEAEEVFERALAEAQVVGNRYDPRVFSYLAWFAIAHCGDGREDCALRWHERVIRVQGSLDFQTKADKMITARSSALLGTDVMIRAKDKHFKAIAGGDNTSILDRAALASALPFYERVLSYSNEEFDPTTHDLFVFTADLCADIHYTINEYARAMEYFTLGDSLAVRYGVERDKLSSGDTFCRARAHCLLALGRHAEALVFLRKTTAGEVDPEGENLLDLDLLSKIVEVAELLGVAHELDTQQYVLGSAQCAIDHLDNKKEAEGIQWFLRSETARIHANSPPGEVHQRMLISLAGCAEDLKEQGRFDEAQSLLEQCLALCEAFDEPSHATVLLNFEVLSALGTMAIDRVYPRIRELLNEGPKEILEARELLCENIRLNEQCIIRMASFIKTNPYILPVYLCAQNFRAHLYGIVSLWEKSLGVVDELLAIYEEENEPEAMKQQDLAEIHLLRGEALRHLGRTNDARVALQCAQEVLPTDDSAENLRAKLTAELENLSWSPST
jgi:tetratricopeptide (TPR) repeat protein